MLKVSSFKELKSFCYSDKAKRTASWLAQNSNQHEAGAFYPHQRARHLFKHRSMRQPPACSPGAVSSGHSS